MPAMYTHYKFGQDVMEQLKERKVREVIAHYPKMFDLGLYGPDLLFYYGIPRKNDLHHLGFVLHRQEAAGFFVRAKNRILYENEITRVEKWKKTTRILSKAEGLSYILGMICHFVLDSCCHDYVVYGMREEGVGHAEMEMDLERELLMKDGLSPIHYNPVRIQLMKKEAEQVARFYPNVSAREVGISLQHMRRVTGWMLPTNRLKKGTLHSLFGITGHYRLFRGMMIRATSNKACERTTKKLLACYEKALPIACDLMVNYYRYIFNHEELDIRFYRTYGACANEECLESETVS